MNSNKKYAMPHLNLKNKGPVDLFFEFIDPKDRKNFFEDLISDKEFKIDLPNFGIIDKDLSLNVSNEIKQIEKKDLDKDSINFLERLIKDTKNPRRALIQYNTNKHKFELKQKHDFEKILKEVTERNLL